MSIVGTVQLPRGATGFRHVDSPPLAPVDLRAFKAMAHSVGHVLDFHPAGPTPNFHLLTLRLPSGDLGVVCHASLPLIAFAPVPFDGSFLSRPDLSSSFFGFDTLTAEALATPLARADLSLLDEAEHRQIRHWRPATVGELLFNHWD